MYNQILEDYILEHIDQEDPVLAELYRETHLRMTKPQMISGHLQGSVLRMLSCMVRPNNILEIGTFTGYSAICLCRGLAPGGMLYTIDFNDEITDFALHYLEKAGVQDIVKMLTGDARTIIPELQQQFDLVFIDAEKAHYCELYRLVFAKVPVGGYIIADNVLWSGRVIEHPVPNDKDIQGLLAFNTLVKKDKRVEKVILPVRDGLMIIRKNSD